MNPPLTPELSAQRKEFFDEMLGHYNLNNRAFILAAYGSDGKPYGSCSYSHSVNGGCAIGRRVSLSCSVQLERIGGDVNHVFHHLPDWMKNLGLNFLLSIQWLHDGYTFWTETGLSEAGILFRDQIIKDYITLP